MIQKIETIEQYNRMFGVETKHPLVSVVDVSDYAPAADALTQTVRYGLYAVFLKQGVGCRLRYGREQYDYQAGSIVTMAPGRVVTTEFIEGEHSSWKALLFHPDLLFGTPLANRIREYDSSVTTSTRPYTFPTRRDAPLRTRLPTSPPNLTMPSTNTRRSYSRFMSNSC